MLKLTWAEGRELVEQEEEEGRSPTKPAFQLLSSSFKSSEPVSNVAEDDVSQKTSNIEEGGGYMGPLSIVAH